MKNFEPEYIEKLIEIMKNNELTQVALEDNETSLVIKSDYKPVIKEKTEDEEEAVEVQSATEETVEKPIEEQKKLTPITSDMIGLYYSKPSPNEPPFVKVGDEIKAGQVICIIETIKLINKITSEISGKVAEICIEDGKPVEYGQVIMYVEEN